MTPRRRRWGWFFLLLVSIVLLVGSVRWLKITWEGPWWAQWAYGIGFGLFMAALQLSGRLECEERMEREARDREHAISGSDRQRWRVPPKGRR